MLSEACAVDIEGMINYLSAEFLDDFLEFTVDAIAETILEWLGEYDAK